MAVLMEVQSFCHAQKVLDITLLIVSDINQSSYKD